MKKSEATAYGGVPPKAGKSEITNQDLLQAIQNIDQKLNVQKDDILTAVDQNIDQKFLAQNNNLDQKLAVQHNEIAELKSTVDDVLVTINSFADEVKREFSEVKNDISGLNSRMSGVEERLGAVESRLGDVEGTINTQMVTKDYLDKKFAEFGVEHNDKHKRVEKLTNILHKKKILNVAETQIVLAN